mgnify:CR=1 FL=1|jgi:hypothetical protein
MLKRNLSKWIPLFSIQVMLSDQKDTQTEQLQKRRPNYFNFQKKKLKKKMTIFVVASRERSSTDSLKK